MPPRVERRATGSSVATEAILLAELRDRLAELRLGSFLRSERRFARTQARASAEVRTQVLTASPVSDRPTPSLRCDKGASRRDAQERLLGVERGLLRRPADGDRSLRSRQLRAALVRASRGGCRTKWFRPDHLMEFWDAPELH